MVRGHWSLGAFIAFTLASAVSVAHAHDPGGGTTIFGAVCPAWTNPSILGTCDPCGREGQLYCAQNHPCDAFLHEVLGFCTQCGGHLQPACAQPQLHPYDLDDWYCRPNHQTLTCTECTVCGYLPMPCVGNAPLCGGNDQLPCFVTCLGGCDPGVETHLLANLCGPVAAAVAVYIEPVEQQIGQDIDPAVCWNRSPVVFGNVNIGWPTAERPPGPRTVFVIHGNGGGAYGADGGFGDESNGAGGTAWAAFGPRNVRLYSVDYNLALPPQTLPFRVFGVDANGNAELVYQSQTTLDGVHFTIPQLSAHLRDAIVSIPVSGEVTLVAHSFGGFVARDLVHRYYDELRFRGRTIAQVMFFGHPHLGVLADHGQLEPLVCSTMAGFSPRDPEDAGNARNCIAVRWIYGWNARAGPTIDDAELPQIHWTNVAGAGGPPLADEAPDCFPSLIGASLSQLPADGTVLTWSSEGTDVYNKFFFGQLQFDDHHTCASCGHNYLPMRSALEGAFPDPYTDAAVCGDVVADGVLDGSDLLAYRTHLAGLAPFDANALEACDVGSGDACDLVDVARLQRALVAPTPRAPGVDEDCPAADDLTRQLVVYWKFDELSGATAVNSAGSGTYFAGTLVGNTMRIAGHVGLGALRFDGAGDYVRLSNATALAAAHPVNELSLSIWLRPFASGSRGVFISKEGEFQVSREPDGAIHWAIYVSGPQWLTVPTPAVALENTWSHLALVFDGHAGVVRTYFDGALVQSDALIGPVGDIFPNDDELRAGARSVAGGQAYVGELDEVAVWGRALSAREVETLYSDGAGLGL